MALKPRHVFRGVRRAKYTRLRRLLQMIQSDDSREQAAAARLGAEPNVFVDANNIGKAIQLLQDQCDNKISEMI